MSKFNNLIKIDTDSDGECYFPIGTFFLHSQKGSYYLRTLGRDWVSMLTEKEFNRVVKLLEINFASENPEPEIQKY